MTADEMRVTIAVLFILDGILALFLIALWNEVRERRR